MCHLPINGLHHISMVQKYRTNSTRSVRLTNVEVFFTYYTHTPESSNNSISKTISISISIFQQKNTFLRFFTSYTHHKSATTAFPKQYPKQQHHLQNNIHNKNNIQYNIKIKIKKKQF